MHLISPLHSQSIIPFLSTCTVEGRIALLKRHKKAVSSALFMVHRTSSSASCVPYIPCMGLISSSCFICPTDHPHALHLPDTLNRDPSVATWFQKPSTGMSQLLCFSDSHLRTVRWLFSHWPSVTRYEEIPPCHFRSFFDVFAHCFPSPTPLGFGFWLPSNTGNDTICASLLHPRHVFWSDQPMSYNLFSIQSPSKASSSHFGACLSNLRWSAFEGQLRLALATLFPSTLHTHALLPMSSSRPSWSVSETSFSSCGQTTLMSTATCPSNSKVCHCSLLMSRSRVSRPTATASRLTSFHVWTSKICFLHASFCSVGHFPIQVTSVQACVANVKKSSSWTSRLFNSMKSESETNPFLLLLPSASSTSALLLASCSRGG